MDTNIISRLIKYIITGLIIIIAVRYIPEQSLSTKELIMISLTTVIAFAILDIVSQQQKLNKSKIMVEE